MNQEEFRKLALSGGYANKQTLEKWLKATSKEEFSEEDLAELWRYANQYVHGTHRKGWRIWSKDGHRSTISGRARGLAGNSKASQDEGGL